MTRYAGYMCTLRKNRKLRGQCTRCGRDKPHDGFSQCDDCKDYLVDYRGRKATK